MDPHGHADEGDLPSDEFAGHGVWELEVGPPLPIVGGREDLGVPEDFFFRHGPIYSTSICASYGMDNRG